MAVQKTTYVLAFRARIGISCVRYLYSVIESTPSPWDSGSRIESTPSPWESGSRIDNHILPLQYIRLHLLKHCLLHRLLQWVVLSTYIQKPPGLPLCNQSDHPVLKPLQVPDHTRGNHPRLQSKNSYRLQHRLGENPQHLWVSRNQLFIAFLRLPATDSQ